MRIFALPGSPAVCSAIVLSLSAVTSSVSCIVSPATIGSVNVKWQFLPYSDSMEISPPCFSANDCDNDKPKPEPVLTALSLSCIWKNGSNIFSLNFSSIPIPSSFTQICKLPSTSFTVILIWLFAYFMALAMRLLIIL